MDNSVDTAKLGAMAGQVITIMAVAEENPGRGRRLRKSMLPHGDIDGWKQIKRRGEIGEAMFLTKAMKMGFSVGILWGDSDRYDLIADAGSGLLRVQVKSAHRVSARPHNEYQ